MKRKEEERRRRRGISRARARMHKDSGEEAELVM